ncbi:MAG TPA: hypothetical protein ENK91_16950, partial [Bacteroidetes bacterium]|nr:hypothetical protein [Bacteroidota bacterium]
MSYSVLNYMQATIAFVVSLVLAKKLGSEEFGYYAYGIVFFNVFSILISFGMDKTLVRDLVQTKRDREGYFLASSLFKFLFGAVLGVLLLIWLLYFSDLDAKHRIIVITFSLGGWMLGLSPKAWYDLIGQIQRHAIITLLERIAFLFFVAAIIFFFESSNKLYYIISSFLVTRLVCLVVEWRGI